MKKLLSIFLCFVLCVNVCFANTEDEIEKKSPLKLIAGIAMTLIGGFLIYDGFSKVEEDISRPSVDYAGVMSAYFDQVSGNYYLYTGCGKCYPTTEAKEVGVKCDMVQNQIYNNGNVELTNLHVSVSYRYSNMSTISFKDIGEVVDATEQPKDSNLAIGASTGWSDGKDNSRYYSASKTDAPYPGSDYTDLGLFQEEALNLVDVKVTYDYKKKYKTKNKSDIEGVAGIAVAGAGIYFIIDYFVQLNKFNQYAKKNDLNIRLAKQPNEYKLLLSKRI